MSALLFGWFLCTKCQPAEEWPSDCYDHERGMCRACAHDNPRKVRKDCTGGCGRRVITLDRVERPLCTSCRRRKHGAKAARRRAYERTRYQRQKRQVAA